jgi:hypothetical protein
VVKLGTSYFGTYDPANAAGDLGALSKDHDWLLIPISEELMTYQRDNIARMVTISKALGMETVISPWGVDSHFGGEGLNSPDLTFSQWMSYALRLGADGIMFDEPKLPTVDLMLAVEQTRRAGMKNIFCIEPHRLGEYPFGLLREFDSVGIDPYLDNLNLIEEAVRDFLHARLPSPHVWVRAFRIERGKAAFVESVVRRLTEYPLDLIATWGARGSAAMGVLRSETPAAVGAAAIRGFHGG